MRTLPLNRHPVVLSLFDGLSVGQHALLELGVEPRIYYSCEIDIDARGLTLLNFPNTQLLGDVECWREWDLDWPSVDLIFGGSPCQGFSFAGDEKAFEDPRSRLFYVFAEIVDHAQSRNPDLRFLLENVPMKRASIDRISAVLGVDPVVLDSADFSAQSRRRFYWANFPISQPLEIFTDASTTDDVLESDVDPNAFLPTDRSLQILENEVARGKLPVPIISPTGAHIYQINGETVIVSDPPPKTSNGAHAPMAAQSLNQISKRQNGRRFKPPDSKFYTLTTMDRHGVLTNGAMRYATEREWERFQTLPDDYSAGVDPTSRRRLLGNAWNSRTIQHILAPLFDASTGATNQSEGGH